MLVDKPLLTHKCHYYFLHGEFEREWADVINGFSVHLKCCSRLKMCSLICRNVVYLCVSLSL